MKALRTVGIMVGLVGMVACGVAPIPAGDTGAIDAATDDAADSSQWDSGYDAASLSDAATSDGGLDDAAAIDAHTTDATPGDGGAADLDLDGIAGPLDCDDEDPTVGRTSSRTCSTACDGGMQVCEDAVWSACSASDDCACTTEGMTRGLPCGNCGTRRQRCTGGVWADAGTCLSEGECTAGATETQATPYCVSETRTCSATCEWSAFADDGPRGECRAGQREWCTPPRYLGRLCSDDCAWGPPDPTCE